METECDYLYGWIKKKQTSHIHKNLFQNSEPQRYSWERRRSHTLHFESAKEERMSRNNVMGESQNYLSKDDLLFIVSVVWFNV